MDNKDIGLTHVAFTVKDLAASVAFYQQFADMQVIHRRELAAGDVNAVAWLSDMTRNFAIVLVQSTTLHDTPLGPFGHLGVACASKAIMDSRLDAARTAGILRKEPVDSGAPVGYWAYLSDPDGNTLELSVGQAIGYAIEKNPGSE
ncbi:VOC family protein [Ewingella americana]|jgi:catechol 2,3-dioxygenase-like lactoylglutathione lyase family enzyme|uniref:VOC family protein n=1 Tax=Ewingella americana TaxID=41202 RepID=A0A502GQT4_9GAMM|nr:VOC family protein [Ewingella americana]TPG63882.1 VOC family protein [Ewingella americana]